MVPQIIYETSRDTFRETFDRAAGGHHRSPSWAAGFVSYGVAHDDV